MGMLFTAAELLAATGGVAVGPDFAGVRSVSIDSRDLGEGALFVAIRGERFDGHDFVASALAGGAAAALVSEARADAFAGPLVVVPDPLEALRALARFARARSLARILAVTGSVGKTTTKEALRVALGVSGEVHASLKSFNNHWGVPLTLARLPETARFGVFEIGMNHAGEIAGLVGLVRPHLAIVTAIAPAHLAAFASLADIARAKTEIFSGLEPGGIALVNADHDQLGVLREEAARAGVGRFLTYGFDPASDWWITDYAPRGEGARAVLVHGEERHELSIAAPGRHMIADAAGALIAAVLSGVPAADALRALSGFGAGEGRGRRRRFGSGARSISVIDESYNANPASMRAALEVFAAEDAGGGRKVLVLGEMRELGAESARLHAGLAGAVKASGADAVYLVGAEMGALAEALGPGRVARHVVGAGELEAELRDALAYGDTVMVKGSNGVRLSGLVEAIGQAFSEDDSDPPPARTF